MQTRLLGGYGSGAGGRREPLIRSGGGAETIRSNLVVRHIAARRARCCARPFGKPLIPRNETPGHEPEGLP